MTRLRVLCTQCFESYGREEVDGESICSRCNLLEKRRPSATESQREMPSAALLFDAPPIGFWSRHRAEAEDWCRGRLWWARLPLWLYFAYVLSRHALDPDPYRSIFDAINLGIHELGHVLFRPLGEFMTIAGGTITQCAAPIASVFVFLRQRDYFGVAVCFCWLATNFWGIAVYVGDARALQLPLVAPGMGLMPSGDGSILHDWNHLLGVTGLLRHDTTIGLMFQVASFVSMAVGLAFGAWLLWRMWATSSKR